MCYFHKCSEYIYNWISKQPCVKEESITDWLLYNLSESCPFIYYTAFPRNEEAKNGADWEWWILIPDDYSTTNYYAYRFLIQTKKLRSNGKDNFPLLNYSNTQGLQIDLLLSSAAKKRALPMYMYYTISNQDFSMLVKNDKYLSKQILEWCRDCTNGCYLSPAHLPYDLLYGRMRSKILDTELLNYAYKFSLCDLLFYENKSNIKDAFKSLNERFVKKSYMDNIKKSYDICHKRDELPRYLLSYIEQHTKNAEWIASEFGIDDIEGIGVVDLRNEQY